MDFLRDSYTLAIKFDDLLIYSFVSELYIINSYCDTIFAEVDKQKGRNKYANSSKNSNDKYFIKNVFLFLNISTNLHSFKCVYIHKYMCVCIVI